VLLVSYDVLDTLITRNGSALEVAKVIMDMGTTMIETRIRVNK